MIKDKIIIISKKHFEDASAYAFSILKKLDSSILYHNIWHTKDYVLPAVLKLADMEWFSTEEKYIIAIAALFHDTGFVKQYDKNEQIWAEFAKKYIESTNCIYNDNHTQLIINIILETDIKKTPSNKYSNVLRDADLSYLWSKEDFIKENNNLKLELRKHKDAYNHKDTINEKVWRSASLVFMKDHIRFTKSAEMLYEEQKRKNIVLLEKDNS